MAPSTILIVEHSSDLATLYRRTLEDEGFRVEVAVNPPSPLEALRGSDAALVVLDVLPYGEHALEALDALRADDAGREVPVVVTTTAREIAETALASYNVRAALVKPFDLQEFVEVAQREAGQPTMHASIPDEVQPPAGFMEYAEHVLAQRSRDIIFRWIQRLRQEEPWGQRDDLRLADLIDHAPIVLKALDVRLHYAHPDGFFERHPDALEQARNHAELRRQQGITHGAALREYALLREEIWLALRANPPAALEPEEFFRVEQAINGTIDAILATTAAAYAGEQVPPGTTEIPPRSVE